MRCIMLPPEESRQTLDLLLWLCCAFLPLSHLFSKKTAMLFFHVTGSNICLVPYLCALLPIQPPREQRSAAAASGWRCGCFGAVVGVWLAALFWYMLGRIRSCTLCAVG